MQDIINGLRTKLIADQTSGSLHDKLGGAIFHLRAPQNEALPLMVYSIVSGDPNLWFGGPVTQVVLVDFDIYVSTQVGLSATTGVGTIEESLYDLLEEFELTVSGHDRGVVTFVTRNAQFVEEDAIRITDRVQIMATQFS